MASGAVTPAEAPTDKAAFDQSPTEGVSKMIQHHSGPPPAFGAVPSMETDQQRGIREWKEAREFFAHRGCLDMAEVPPVRKGKSCANTGRLTQLGSLRKRPHITDAGLKDGHRSPVSVSNLARTTSSLMPGVSGRSMHHRPAPSSFWGSAGLEGGGASSKWVGKTVARRHVSLVDLAAEGFRHTGQVNPFVMRMGDRTPFGSFYTGNSDAGGGCLSVTAPSGRSIPKAREHSTKCEW
eukprot:TRINITY_DN104483_c0_g1_i1.p1 TRINITY_DN104483_c0_g1~~TRINITY_DN104483_c0_g1_i1.p1  ORF type:complete len:237 (-),score=20.36 TRINITY_DN104483_c0_g1_i1:224-934(-)